MNNALLQKKKAHIAVSLIFTGAAGRNRTGDLRITNALLYQLSYSGDKARIIQAAVASINRDAATKSTCSSKCEKFV